MRLATLYVAMHDNVMTNKIRRINGALDAATGTDGTPVNHGMEDPRLLEATPPQTLHTRAKNARRQRLKDTWLLGPDAWQTSAPEQLGPSTSSASSGTGA